MESLVKNDEIKNVTFKNNASVENLSNLNLNIKYLSCSSFIKSKNILIKGATIKKKDQNLGIVILTQIINGKTKGKKI